MILIPICPSRARSALFKREKERDGRGGKTSVAEDVPSKFGFFGKNSARVGKTHPCFFIIGLTFYQRGIIEERTKEDSENRLKEEAVLANNGTALPVRTFREGTRVGRGGKYGGGGLTEAILRRISRALSESGCDFKTVISTTSPGCVKAFISSAS